MIMAVRLYSPTKGNLQMQKETQEKSKRAIVAAVQLPSVTDIEFEASLTELRELAKTLGFEVVRTFTQKRPGFDSTAYLGTGKRQEIRQFVNNEFESAEWQESEQTAALDTNGIDVILVDHEISPSQARNLEKEIGCAVMDRTMVILEIFHRNARSPAARAQVEIARLGYMAPRLREMAKLAGPRGRKAGNVAASVAGVPVNRTLNWIGAKSVIGLLSCNWRSSRWMPNAKHSAHVDWSAGGSLPWRSSVTPTQANPL